MPKTLTNQLSCQGFTATFVVGAMYRPLPTGERYAATIVGVPAHGAGGDIVAGGLRWESYGFSSAEAEQRLRTAFDAWAITQSREPHLRSA